MTAIKTSWTLLWFQTDKTFIRFCLNAAVKDKLLMNVLMLVFQRIENEDNENYKEFHQIDLVPDGLMH